MRAIILAACAALSLSACATYTTPSAGVDISGVPDGDIAEAFSRKPAMTFPARVAVARLGPGGPQRLNIESTRQVEGEDDFTRLTRLPQVNGVAPISRLFISGQPKSFRDLRAAAAELRADALLVYGVDSRFRTETTELGPLQTVALGMLATRKAYVTATTSFVLIDVRTGFVYGVGESTATESQRGNVWSSARAVDEARIRAERKAFEDAVGEMERLWIGVLAEHAPSRLAAQRP